MISVRFAACLLALCAHSALALVHIAALPSSRQNRPALRATRVRCGAVSMKYIPDGLTEEQWQAIKAKEAKALKNLGKVGTTKFKSRSFQAWQEALERGEGGHLFPVNPDFVKAGKVKLSEVPYMQRGGSWDDEDLVKKEKGIKKKVWTEKDLKYSMGGERAAQSINIFGTGANLPWGGRPGFKDPNALDPIKEQAKWKRGKTNLPPNKMAMLRIEKEKAELEKQRLKKEKELSKAVKETKRFLFW